LAIVPEQFVFFFPRRRKMLSNYPVDIIAAGVVWREPHIEVVEEPWSELPPDLQVKVDENWRTALTLNPHLRNGDLLCGKRVELIDGGRRIRLVCGLSNYKNFMGTTYPDVPEEHRHRAIGIMCVVSTSDYVTILGVRSPKIDWGTLLHVAPAGRMKPGEHPFSAIIKEFKQELGVEKGSLRDLECCGVVGDLTQGRMNFEFVFRCNLRLSFQQLLSVSQQAASGNEHSHLLPLDATSLANLLCTDPDAFVPTGWAGLIIAEYMPRERERQGMEWNPTPRTYEEHMGRRLKMLIK
jgi:ADP-ribose pyrophosphatase YjhB (NUDIX family)